MTLLTKSSNAFICPAVLVNDIISIYNHIIILIDIHSERKNQLTVTEAVKKVIMRDD